MIDLTRARWNDLAQQRGVMIELKADLAADLANIRGAENEIRDALTNLIFNAVDALPHARVVNLSSMAAAYGQASLATYSATKFAVRGLTEALNIEWQGDGIRASAVEPAGVNRRGRWRHWLT